MCRGVKADGYRVGCIMRVRYIQEYQYLIIWKPRSRDGYDRWVTIAILVAD